MDNIKGSVPPGPRMMHPNEEEIRSRVQETSEDEQRTPALLSYRQEIHRTCKWGQATRSDYREVDRVSNVETKKAKAYLE